MTDNTGGFIYRTPRFDFISKFKNKYPAIICPGFYILHWAAGCLGECSYCWLKGTMTRYFSVLKNHRHLQEKPKLVLCTNIGLMEKQIERMVLNKKTPFVLNAGELADSFCGMDKKTLDSILRPFNLLKDTPHKILFVTKFDPFVALQIEPTLLDNAIFSFSLSPFSKYERGTEPWKERIQSAKALDRPVRLRLDPLIPEFGWMPGYRELVEEILKPPTLQIERVTLGRLRFFPVVKSTMTDKAKLLEFAPKRRPEDKRFVLPDEDFLKMAGYIITLFPLGTQFALCKEPEYIWKKFQVYGLDYKNPKCNCVL